MDVFQIEGPVRLSGHVEVNGSKNASLPIMAAALLAPGRSTLLGVPRLARCGRGEVSMPGGCAIGDRPIDLHLNGVRQLGAQIHLKSGYVIAEAPQGLQGASLFL